MQPTNVVLLQSDPNVAHKLASSLAQSFHRVHVARSLDELRHAALKHRPFAVILDLESATLGDVEALKKDFEEVRVICNHRVADEEMWTKTLSAGADDCCPSSDMHGILTAAVRSTSQSDRIAA